MAAETWDDFTDVTGWNAFASGQAQLLLERDAGERGHALRLAYDFHGGGGFVVARKDFPRTLPSRWALELRVRGAAPANKLELKLADRAASPRTLTGPPASRRRSVPAWRPSSTGRCSMPRRSRSSSRARSGSCPR